MNKETIRLSGYVNDSLVDGPGVRLAIFTQGCLYACPGCHNPHTWDPKGGVDVPIDDLVAVWRKNPLLDGITLSGGEPLYQKEKLLPLLRAVVEDGLNVVMYTGSTYEALIAKEDPVINEILTYVDYLIDGPFVLAKKNLTLLYRGSSNQRIIALKKSTKDQLVLIEKMNEF